MTQKMVPIEALEEVRDLLMERVHGNPARSPAHNARLKVEAMLAAAPSAPVGREEVAEVLKGLVLAYAMNNAEPGELRDALREPITRASAILSLLNVQPDDNGWQDISTAPAAPEMVLIATCSGEVGEAYLRALDDEDDGWWWVNTGWGDYPSPHRPDDPTHWRPLPQPPAIMNGGR